MKILSNAKFKGMVDKIKELEEEKENIKKKYDNKDFKYLEDYNTYRDKCIKLEETNKYHQKLIELRDSDIERLSKKLRQANGARGGFVARINELIKQVDEVTEKFDKYREEKEIEIADLKSSRYLKVKVRPDKSKSHQKMQIYSTRTSKNSEIIKNVKDEEEC